MAIIELRVAVDQAGDNTERKIPHVHRPIVRIQELAHGRTAPISAEVVLVQNAFVVVIFFGIKGEMTA
jgi:hypothetical protein